MKKILPPLIGIALTIVILALINLKNDNAFISKFAVVFIMIGMFLGLWVGKLINGNKNQNDKK